MDGDHDRSLTSTLGPFALGRLRAVHAQILELQRKRDEMLSLHIEAIGHHPPDTTITHVDFDTGALRFEPKRAAS